MRYIAGLTLLVVTSSLCAGAQPPEAQTTIADQKDVAVTVYNGGVSLVRDVRETNLPDGEFKLKFMDVAEQIRPETVSLKSLAAPGSVAVLEQNYEYDLMSPQKLLEKYVGKKVRLVNFSKQIGFEEVTAELLSTNQGSVFKVGDEIYLGHPGNVVLPEIPDNLIAKPSLIWLLENKRPRQRLEVTYLTGGISWKADYVLTLSRDDKTLDLAGWVTLDNQSGATYTNARLKLVAGEVSVVEQSRPPQMALKRDMAMAAEAGAMLKQEAFAEYHLYTMPRRTTIKQNQSKQVILMEAFGVGCEKNYEFRGQQSFYSRHVSPMRDQHVDVYLKFKNEEDNQLGVPLPGGIMRIYQADSEGMMQFAGEDRIKHTPKNEDVRLRMGKAFDVVADRIQKDYSRISDRVHESEFEITIRNHKDTDIVADVVEPMPGDWDMVDNSHKFDKRDAHTAVFHIPVQSDGEARLTYRVRVRY